MIHHSAIIHAKAHVDKETCQVGAGTRICQFASVTRGTVLGEDCVVWPFAMLDGSTFGDRCKIASGVAMGAGFLVGNDVFIGPNVTVCNDMWPRVDRDGYDDEALRAGEKHSVIIEDSVSIGAGAVILPGVRVGKGSMIGAGVVLNRSIEPGSVLLFVDGNGKPTLHQRAEYAEVRMRWAR